MKVNIKLFANLRQYNPAGDKNEVSLELHKGDTVSAIHAVLYIPDDIETVVLVNGRFAKDDTKLENGDQIVIYPPIAGG